MKPGRLQVEYLKWVKDLDQRLYEMDKSSAYYNLSHSGICEPTGILLDHVNRYFADLAHRLEELNPWGQPTLIGHIAARYTVGQDRILLTTGASDAIFLVCQTLLAEGGHVIVETPVYEPLLAVPTFFDAEISFLRRRAENDYQPDLDELKSLLTPQTKLIILSNLHNPSSALLETGVLQEISTAARRVGAKVLVDEVYHDFVEAEQRSAAALDDTFISISSLSKVYGLSVLRCGWIVAAPEMIDQIRRVYVLVENIGSRFIETLASIVFENLESYGAHWYGITSQNRETVKAFAEPLLRDGLIGGDVPPTGCILFPKIAHVGDENDMRRFLHRLEVDYQVFVAPGFHFRAPKHIRIGFGGKKEELQIGLERLAEAIRSWR